MLNTKLAVRVPLTLVIAIAAVCLSGVALSSPSFAAGERTPGSKGNGKTIQTKGATGPGAEAGKASPRRSDVFDYSDQYVRPDPNRVKRLTPDQRRALPPEDRLKKLRTRSVTPNGRVSEIELSPEMRQRIIKGIGLLQAEQQKQALKGERSVIGRDERERVGNSSSFPYSATGYLENGCSGALIGPRHVLTAGHCVFNIGTNKWYAKADFWPGQNGDRSPYGRVGWARLLSVDGWTADHDREYDYGVVILKQRVGNQAGWFGYGYEDPMPLYTVNIIGYPADKPRFTQWRQTCEMVRATGTEIYHDCDTYGGNSGSPLYTFDSSADNRTIYGVHAWGHGSDADANSGTMLTKDRYETLQGWVKQYR